MSNLDQLRQRRDECSAQVQAFERVRLAIDPTSTPTAEEREAQRRVEVLNQALATLPGGDA